MMKKIPILLLLISFFISCEQLNKKKGDLEFEREQEDSVPNSNERDEQVDDTVIIPEVTVSYTELKQRVLDPYSCTLCHGWAKSEKLLRKRFVPNDPENSSLYEIVKSGRMPRGGKAVPTKDLEILELYIKNFKE